jgi:anti-sigma factor RsiW
MPDCSRIDPLVTPFVDGELPQDEQQTLTQHITACPACRGKVMAERAIRSVMRTRRSELSGPPAPADLKARCTLLLLAGVFLYQATRGSSRVLAAELTMDHEKCFRLNRLLGTHNSAEAVEAEMASGFDWNVQLPDEAELNLVGSRPCLSGEGKVAHIMYTYNGQPVSLFMLPRDTRASELVQVFGHRARIWSEGGRTFVLVARESASEMERMAALVRTTIR